MTDDKELKAFVQELVNQGTKVHVNLDAPNIKQPVFTSGYYPEKRKYLFWMARIFGKRMKQVEIAQIYYWRGAYWQWK